ncbi:RNA polymerase II transcription factor B subunit 1 [Lunasporangiospora selenospora]|uniref:RNA polymerase II transcription factor B subunit 1 n=1 Tax=Lunasporangiospora selenospora TaxID=979761 RepID=A0A9P6KIV0_9FUNG|nr:RNA polymerase II transcription factor B subunit 1 [Lunasporangiospora selenospora]
MAPTVSVKHDDIKGLFVNAESAEKVKLRIVEIKPDTSHNFVFPSTTAVKERNDFKDGISTVLQQRQQRTLNSSNAPTPTASGVSPASSPAVSDVSAPGTPRLIAQARMGGGALRKGPIGAGHSAELKVRFELLKQNKELAALHKDLVMGKHVTEEEFWETRKHLLRNKTVMDQQQKGQSSAWLDLKPETGESNDVKYVMTPQVIHSVCQQYPSIKRAYDTYVPDKLSEAEFWKRYFQSRFFHRSRSGRGANEPDDEIFDKALEEDEAETKSAPKRIRLDHINKLVDLSTTEEDHFESYTTPDSTMAAGKTKESKEAMPLIRRFNRYAQRVLNSTVGLPKKQTSEGLNMNGVERAMLLEDLQGQKEVTRITLDIQDTRRYFESQGGNMKSSKISEDQATQLLPPLLYQEALSCHAAGNEILRHFWASTSPDKAVKHQRMVESLKKIRDENMKSLMIQASSLGAECLDGMKMMMKPLNNSIAKALKHADSRPKMAPRRLL